MRIQAFLTAAAVSLKRLAAALCALLGPYTGARLLLSLLSIVAADAKQSAMGVANSASARAA